MSCLVRFVVRDIFERKYLKTKMDSLHDILLLLHSIKKTVKDIQQFKQTSIEKRAQMGN